MIYKLANFTSLTLAKNPFKRYIYCYVIMNVIFLGMTLVAAGGGPGGLGARRRAFRAGCQTSGRSLERDASSSPPRRAAKPRSSGVALNDKSALNRPSFNGRFY